MSLTSPLGLTRHVRRPDLRLEVVPWLNVLLVAWLLSLLGSRFVYAPGLAVDLGHGSSPLPVQLVLPTLSGGPLPGSPADAVLTVLTAKQDKLFIFEGRIYDLNGLRTVLRNHRHSAAGGPSVLLLKAGQDVNMQTFLEICTLARTAGFSSVQIAAEEPHPGAVMLNPDATPVSP
jgi:biopolymer transport protein ExbD